ncbi:MAG: hypothetical protein WAZ12_05060 [Candidatus Absconditicoccaceae bacterium]
MEDPIIQEIRDGFDELFLGSESQLTPTTKELFQILGIDGFAEIYLQSKKYGFAISQKILQDLVKLSFVVYSNLDKLPIETKVILPQENGSHKFIVTSLPENFMRGNGDSRFEKEDTNVLFLVSTGDDMHAKIAEKLGLKSKLLGEFNILGGAWIDIDHQNKSLNIRDDSGSYGSCSNQFVEWMLQDYKDQGYTITINMKDQREFFTQEY